MPAFRISESEHARVVAKLGEQLLATAVALTIVDILQELAGLGDRHVQQLLLPLGSDNES